MPIQRTCDFQPFYMYITDCALLPYVGQPSEELRALALGSCRWLDIPTFQRGVAWDVQDIMDDLFGSESPILGNVLLGQFRRTEPLHGITEYSVIIDGLQRFTVGTALLATLHPLVLHHEPECAADASLFKTLIVRCGNLAPVFMHNDRELAGHRRQAVSHAYCALRKSIECHLRQLLSSGQAELLSKRLTEIFLSKQIAIDVYHNFDSQLDMMSAFLGINTIRVDLSPVDLLRSFVVERANQAGWDQDAIEASENQITEVFTTDDKNCRKELVALVSICLSRVRDDQKAEVLFPSWCKGFKQEELTRFLRFVVDMTEINGNGYVREIRSLGALPFAALILNYYLEFLRTGDLPTYFDDGALETTALHKFFRGCFRAFLEGKIGKSRPIVETVLKGTSLEECAEKLSESYSGFGLSTKYDPGRMEVLIQRADPKKSRSIFNATILPEKPGVSIFEPMVFGNKSLEFHIDHLIPQGALDNSSAGYLEANTIRNLCPLPSQYNKDARDTPCSIKLGPSGVYQLFASKAGASSHPYIAWLVDKQDGLGSQLDDQANLLSDIGSDRIKTIANMLCHRI